MVLIVVYFYLLASPCILKCVGGSSSGGSNSVVSATIHLSAGITSGSNSLSSSTSNNGNNINISHTDTGDVQNSGSINNGGVPNDGNGGRSGIDIGRTRVSNDQQLSATLSSRIVHTRNGAITGVIKQLESRHLDPVESYRGIPYASPPIGNLRFMPPVSAAMWSGVRKADRFSPVCPQRLPNIANETAALDRMPKGRLEYLKRLLPYLQTQSEDCLYLNIYVPIQAGSRDSPGSSSKSGSYSGSTSSSNGSRINGHGKYSVLVFVHGESYEWNSGNPYDGSVLASYGQILVVTINYRLGILGFLNANTHPYSKLPANYGLMDIIAALHWLKENIAAFGGDPQSITLAGHGTGAACVHFLISSMAVPEGLLFNRAILMSGSGLTPWSLVDNPSKYAAIVAQHVNCSIEVPHGHLMKCLRDKTFDQLMSVSIRQPEFGYAFGPSIDSVVIDGGDTVALSSIMGGRQENMVLRRKLAINKLSRYDLMAGVTRAEAFFSFSSGDVQYGIEADRRSKILKSYVRNKYVYHLNEIFATIVNEYTDWERTVQHPINIRDETLEALSDAQFVAPAAQTVDLHSADHRNSYLYVFDYQTKYGDFPQRQGCIHGEDLPYVFGAPLVGGLNHFSNNYTKSEVGLSEMVMLYWSNFVRTGNPNEQMEGDHSSRQEKSRYKTVEWTAYESVHKKYLNFDTKPKLKNHYRAHRLSFWLNLIPDLHKPGGDNVPESHHQLNVDNSITKQQTQSTVKSLIPPLSRIQSNYTVFTSQVFSLLNLSSPSPSVNYNNSSSRYNQKVPHSLDTLDLLYENDFSGGQHSTTSPQDDGFAAYSTALSVTIAIGCSLLILNVLIFAGVYYQRDKTRLNEPRNQTKNISENGQMTNNICGDLETLTMNTKSDPATILGHHHAMQHHQLLPPDFAGIPHRAPPPPKHMKSVPDVGRSGDGGVMQSSPQAFQLMGNQCGSLLKKSCMKQSGGGVGSQINQTTQSNLEELRV